MLLRVEASLLLRTCCQPVELSWTAHYRLGNYQRLQDWSQQHKICIDRLLYGLRVRQAVGHICSGLRNQMWPHLLCTWYASGLSCNVVSTREKSIVWMNWNGSSLTSGAAVLNNWFLTRLLTCAEEDFERVSVLKEDTSSTDCELTRLI